MSTSPSFPQRIPPKRAADGTPKDQNSHPNKNKNSNSNRDKKQGDAKMDVETDKSTPILAAFAYFRAELDEHHDRRERIIKVSRDVTAQSKKIIFALQRHRKLGRPLSGSIASEVSTRKAEIFTLLASIAPDLTDNDDDNKINNEDAAATTASSEVEASDQYGRGSLNRNRYARQISPGLQELVEAAVFEWYLTHQKLLPLPDLRSLYLPENLQSLLSEQDYLLGVYDATGEMMRFAVTGMATGGSIPEGLPGDQAPGTNRGGDKQHDTTAIEAEGKTQGTSSGSNTSRSVLVDMRELRVALETLDLRRAAPPFARDCEKKAEVMRHSVEKVEMAAYGLIVRGKERPKGWVPEATGRAEAPSREEIEGY